MLGRCLFCEMDMRNLLKVNLNQNETAEKSLAGDLFPSFPFGPI